MVVDIAILALALASGGGSRAPLSLSAEGSALVPGRLEPAGTGVLYFGVAPSSDGLLGHTHTVIAPHECRPEDGNAASCAEIAGTGAYGEVLLVRPGSGAGSLSTGAGGPTDLGPPHGGLIRICPAAVKPVGHSPPPPAELTAGDVVVRVAPRPMEYCALIAGPGGKPNQDQIFGERRR